MSERGLWAGPKHFVFQILICCLELFYFSVLLIPKWTLKSTINGIHKLTSASVSPISDGKNHLNKSFPNFELGKKITWQDVKNSDSHFLFTESLIASVQGLGIWLLHKIIQVVLMP